MGVQLTAVTWHCWTIPATDQYIGVHGLCEPKHLQCIACSVENQMYHVSGLIEGSRLRFEADHKRHVACHAHRPRWLSSSASWHPQRHCWRSHPTAAARHNGSCRMRRTGALLEAAMQQPQRCYLHGLTLARHGCKQLQQQLLQKQLQW